MRQRAKSVAEITVGLGCLSRCVDAGLRWRIESRRHGVVVSTGHCGLSRCVGAGCVEELRVEDVEL